MLDLSLLFGPKSQNYEYTTKYNGVSFKTRLRQFFRKKKYREGQIINLGGEDLFLVRFVRYNNVFAECWEVKYLNPAFSNLGTFQKFLRVEESL